MISISQRMLAGILLVLLLPLAALGSDDGNSNAPTNKTAGSEATAASDSRNSGSGSASGIEPCTRSAVTTAGFQRHSQQQ